MHDKDVIYNLRYGVTTEVTTDFDPENIFCKCNSMDINKLISVHIITTRHMLLTS